MVLGTVLLGPIICQVASAWAPMETGLKSCHSVPEPVKPHVHCLRLFWLNLVVDDAICCGIVGLHWCWWFRVSHFCKYVSEVDSSFCIDENPSELCFWCGVHNCFDDLRYVKGGSVVWGDVCFGGQEKISSCSSACPWFAMLACVAMDRKHYVARTIR